MDVLRTLITAYRLGSFSRAAAQIGRSQSAVSQQIDKLEQQVGEPLFVKQGRGLALTEAGELVLSHAQRILDLNDEAVEALRGRAVEGVVRFGLPADFAEVRLPAGAGSTSSRPIRRFGSRPWSIATGGSLQQLDGGDLDLVLALDNDTRADAQPVATLPLGLDWQRFGWSDLGSRGAGAARRPVRRPAAFVSAPSPRSIRPASPGASPSPVRACPGSGAAVEAGLGVTLRTAIALPDQLCALPGSAGLPPLPAPSPRPVCTTPAERSSRPWCDCGRSSEGRCRNISPSRSAAGWHRLTAERGSVGTANLQPSSFS